MFLQTVIPSIVNLIPIRRTFRPQWLIYTAPSGAQSWLWATSAEWDASSLNEQTGEWGVWWIEGQQYRLLDNGEWATMRRVVPAYTLKRG